MIAAIAMCKDEIDIAPFTVRWMASQVDVVIVADNGSTDGTREWLASMEDGDRFHVIDDPEVAYMQSEKMTRLAGLAREMGATWVVPFDADEAWYSPHGRIGDVLGTAPASVKVALAALYDHVPTTIDDPDDQDPLTRIGWRRRDRGRLDKVAARCAVDLVVEQGNHGARYVGPHRSIADLLVVRHFPYRSAAQMVRKARNGAAAYAAAGDRLAPTAGQHWRDYGRIIDTHGPEALEGVFYEYFWSDDPTADEGLIYDPAPLEGYGSVSGVEQPVISQAP